MDFEALNPAAKGCVEMPVCHPATGKPLIDPATGEPVTISVVSRDDASARKVMHDLASSKVNTSIRGRVHVDPSEMEDTTLAVLEAVIKGWKHVGLDAADDLPFTPENLRKVFKRIIWLREQVETFVADRGNFLGN